MPVARRTPRGGFDSVRQPAPVGAGVMDCSVVCYKLAVCIKIACNIAGFNLNKTVSQISRDVLGFIYGYLSARLNIVYCSVKFNQSGVA